MDEPINTCPKCGKTISVGATRCWNKECDSVDISIFTKCIACGKDILIRTAEATGGYCRSGKCEAERKAHAIKSSLIKEGVLQPCPLCGNLVRASKLTKHIEQKCERIPRPHPYAKFLPHVAIPEWLKCLASANTLPSLIPLKDLLQESCFYPSSGLDSSPVLVANGCVHSFVYVDYGTSQENFYRNLRSPGFSPYIPILGRNIEKHEIVPAGWTPQFPLRFDNPGFDSRQRLMEAQSRCRPFGHWSIWQRREKRDERFGPQLFSFLFLGGEALASYQGLYVRNEIFPKILAIIQPGHSFGDNWTNFNDPDAPLWQAVLHGAGLPEFLLLGTYGRHESETCLSSEYTFIHRAMTYEDGGDRHKMWRTINIFKKTMT
jgi:hypothetical protein